MLASAPALEDNSGLRSILRFAWAYEAFQRSVGKNKLRRRFVDEFVRPVAGERIFDIGCGPGDLVPFLDGVDYVGYDISSGYIEAARSRFGHSAEFHDGDLADLFPALDASADVAVAVGVLHHVPDQTAIEITTAAKRALVAGGRFIAAEPHLHADQHWIARELIKRDRGQFVRSEDEYERLLRETFDSVSLLRDEKMLRVPYTLTMFVCE